MGVNNVIVKTKHLTKKYGKHEVVKDINIQVQKGSIYGFIGLNGAGKSTCLRMIAGLTDASKGTIELFDETNKKAVNEARKRIGTMIEGPDLYPHMTAKQNLEVVRIQRGVPGKGCIAKTLKQVGLEDTGNKKARTFSLGMKQRLGIAIALLSNPELLILDEPINGLDPVGVVEMRQLFKALSEEYGVTIIISSHILTEVYHIATHYGIIHHGELIEQCTREEIEEKSQAYILLRVNDKEKAVTIIEENVSESNYEVLEDGAIKLYSHVDDSKTVARILHENNIIVEELTPKHDTLEGYFTRLVKGVSV